MPGGVIQLRGEVPARYHDRVRNLMLDAMRIEARAEGLRLAHASAVMRSYVPDVVWVRRAALLRIKEDLVEKWRGHGADSVYSVDELRADTAAMDAAFTEFNTLFNQYNFSNLRNTIMAAVRADGRVVEDRDLWHHIRSLPNLLVTPANALGALIGAQIVAWQNPRLSVWLREAGYAAAPGGQLRIAEVPDYQGVKVHMTLYIANVDGPASINDPVNDVMDTILPSANGNHIGTHVTLELFGRDDERNPHYFKGEGFYIKYATRVATRDKLAEKGIGEGALEGALGDRLTDKLAQFRARLAAFVAKRLLDYH
jgi:hypothetical protein